MTIRTGGQIIAGSFSDSQLETKANLNLNNSTAISNCITEIPQDIKLELNNGTLTLKAGSKVYVPNGFESDGTTPKFDIETLESDLTTKTTGTAQMYICKISGEGIFGGYMTGGTVTERPSSPINYAIYYNTTTNICEGYWDGAWHTLSFPIAIATRGSSGYESIDKVFNGFGYIGSTVFALPGVKGLIPNGRNTDGTLKNIEFELDTVSTYNMTTNKVSLPMYICSNDTIDYFTYGTYFEDVNKNIKTNTNGQIFGFEIGRFSTDSNSKITYFSTNSTFHAFGWNDLRSLPNYNPSTTQTLKHVNGVLQWG